MAISAENSFKNKEELINWISQGNKVDFLFFWQHHLPEEHPDHKTNYLSHWYKCEFEVDGIFYSSVQQFMMAEKARLYNDHKIETEILLCNEPHYASMLGRQLQIPHEGEWKKIQFDTCVRSNIAKFTQCSKLKTYLLSTKDTILVEANPNDLIWSAGLEASDKKAKTPPRWKGQNLLGFALMQARSSIMS